VSADRPQSASDAVRFVLDGQLVTASQVPPTLTVLEYLRDIAHRTGTKEGCAEGDCGACTVALGELAADGSHVRYRAVNSCIRLLPTIDGQEAGHRREPAGRRRQPAPGAAGNGRSACIAMRVLHARIRDVAVRAVPADGGTDARASARIPVRQSVSLHGLSPDHRSGLPHGRLSAAGALETARRRTHPPAARHCARSGASKP
jgi:hypothetical protein